MNASSIRNSIVSSAIVMFSLGSLAAADQPGMRAVLILEKDRKPAADFALTDETGKTVKLRDYRGKVVLLDFWATWCLGCKKEIPWFSEFHKTYQGQGFAAIGVSLDEKGWTVLRPFLADANIPYQILLGNEGTAKSYGIKGMPDTFLIDRQGRIAAAYTENLVNRENADGHIRALLSEH